MWRSLIVAVGICSASAGYAQQLPAPKPSARDLYIGCNLLVRRTDVPKGSDGQNELFSATWCSLAAIKAITHREGKRAGQKYVFCLPNSAEMSTDPSRAMAFAYIDYYESIVNGIEDKDGETMYMVSLIQKWPCA